MISVAMASYNGENYIWEQLESIYCQTMNVDEIIIVDDCSKDRTVLIVNDFIKKYPDCNIQLVENKENLGYKKNFHKAISMCKGDVVFLCDQDDRWLKNKVEIMKNILDEHEEIALLSSSFFYMDGNGEKSEKNRNVYKKKMPKEELFSVKMEELLFHNISQGCSMAIRREVIDSYLKYVTEELPHDWILNVIATMKKKCYYLNRALFYYRIHDNNTIGLNEGLTLKKKNTFSVRAHDAKQAIHVIELIRNVDGAYYSEDAFLEKATQFASAHVKNLKEKKCLKLLFQNFNPYYWKVKTIRGRMLDIIYCFHNEDSLEKEEK